MIVMRTKCPWTFKIGLLVILLGGMAAQPGFAKGGKGAGHVLAKSAARPSRAGANLPSQGGLAKADTAHAPVTRSTSRRSYRWPAGV